MPTQGVTVTWKGVGATRAIHAGALRGLDMVGKLILSKSSRIVPLDEGTLQDSGKSVVDEKNFSVAVTYDTPYAVRQHEDLTLHHANGRKAKYLETPWREVGEKQAGAIIARQIEKAIG